MRCCRMTISRASNRAGYFFGSIMKTFSAKAHEVTREWYVIDATDKVLGRVASEVARRLRGKHKPEFTPHVDTGDFIIIVNAGKLRVTGNKSTDKKAVFTKPPSARCRNASRAARSRKL
jgi:large subunit ribosomal protein L13